MSILKSLKTKIVVLLLSLTLAACITLLYLFVNFYKKDKMAYLFDTSSSVIETYKSQFDREIEFNYDLLKKHLQQLNTVQRLSLNEDDFLSDTSTIEALFVFKKLDGLSISSRLLKKTTDSELEKKVTSFVQNQTLDSQNVNIDKSTVMVSYVLKQGSSSWIFVEVHKSTIIDEFISNQQLKNIAVMNKFTGVINYKYKDIESAQARAFNEDLIVSAAGAMEQNFFTSIIKVLGKNYLLSFSRLGKSDNFLVSFIDEDKAFENLKVMVYKAILVFVVIAVLVFFVSLISAHYVTQRLKKLTESADEIAKGNFNIQVNDSGADEVSVLSSGFNKMTKEISRLLLETASNARMESELKTAQAVQSTLFPLSEYKSDYIHIKGRYMSASECGGDWWYYAETDTQIWLWIADATGHGAPAALLTSAAKSAVSIVEQLGLSAEKSINYVNQAICSVSKENMMMTCFLGVIDKGTHVLTYINASHEPSMLLKQSNEISKDDFIYLNESNNPRLGQSRETEFKSSQIQLSKHDRIIFYTDGVTDIRNPDGKLYSERLFLKDLASFYNQTKDLDTYFDLFTERIDQFRNKTELYDDVTFFIIELI